MDGHGLTRFVVTNNNDLRKLPKSKSKELNAISNVFQGNSDCAEIKIGPTAYSNSKMSEFAASICKAQDNLMPKDLCKTSLEYSQFQINQMERLHFCVHFIRTSSSIRKRQKIWKEGLNLKNELEKTSGWQNLDIFKNIKKNNFEFKPKNWIRGLDVAGNENAVKTELFAPMIRWLMNVPLNNYSGQGVKHDFHLSIHAGEDYSHPTSGMRSIDETVQFCKMKRGDRLGHALAIGINPKEWMIQQGDVLMPVEEHLDNLVWLWHYAVELKDTLESKFDSFNDIISSLENRINHFSKHVPWTSIAYMKPFYKLSNKAIALSDNEIADNPGVPPAILYDAWLLRKNCFYQFEQYKPTIGCTDIIKFGVPDLDRLIQFDWNDNRTSNNYETSPERLYFQRSELMRDSTGYGKGKIVHLHMNPRKMANTTKNGVEVLEEYQSDDELHLLYALQDHLINKYEKLGIIIETNPSSNLYISRLESYSEHPIFRWHPIDNEDLLDGKKYNKFGLRSNPIHVTINTDDPGIMPTTLRTEYALLVDAAVNKGVDEKSAEYWAEGIRKFSHKLFEDVHKPVFTKTR